VLIMLTVVDQLWIDSWSFSFTYSSLRSISTVKILLPSQEASLMVQ